MQALDYLTLLLTFAGLAFFASKRLRQSLQWRATITPLASIIGSGFLVVAPLLHALIGRWALAGMCVLLLMAYAIGSVIRFNIQYAEPHLAMYPGDGISKLETVAELFLGLAFAISVAFYTSLLVAFLFDALAIDNTLYIDLTTSALLLCIMSVAWWRGSHGLESVELIAVTIKLAIITATLIALASYDLISGKPWFEHDAIVSLNLWDSLAMLAGMLMVTQGFETARYMGVEYDAATRVKALKYSQWVSTIIYLLFIAVTNPIFLEFPVTELSETTIIHVLGQVLIVLPVLLLVAAVSSQLSAALADTIGGGGLLRELTSLKLGDNFFYMIVIGIAIVLIWTSHVFEIINYASKGFAVYYLIQVLVSIKLLLKDRAISHRAARLFGCYCLVAVLAFVIFASIPAPHH